MPALALDCPHCDVKKSSFAIAAARSEPLQPANWSVLANCTACQLPIVMILVCVSSSNRDPMQFPGDLGASNSGFVMTAMFPKLVAIDMPTNVPEGVAKAFKQAAESRRAGHLDAAAAMYRKAMELGLKVLSPDIAAWKIEKRIDKMAAEGLITKDLQDWAHELRLDGNDVLHEDEATSEMIDQMHSLCKFLLTYLYTLPEQVKAARERRAVLA